MTNIINNKTNKTLTKYISWLEEQNLAEKTIKNYLESIRSFNNVFDKQITLSNLSSFFQEKIQKLAVNTVIGLQTALKSYTKFQKLEIEWKTINKIIPKNQTKPFSTLGISDLEKLKQTKIGKEGKIHYRNNLILDFLFYTGLRLNEITNLKHSDWQDNSLRILGKGNKVRYVLLPPFLLKHIKINSNNYLFLTQNGKQLSKKAIQKIVNLKVKKSGLKKIITTHSFRRSFATNLDKNNARLTTIQKLLGHSDIATTARYIHNDYQTLYDDYSKLWKSEVNIS